MDSFSEFVYLATLDQIVVAIPESRIPKSAILVEGRWTASGKKEWMIRVDAPDPAIPLQRHVHIARREHLSAKNQQASWNEDRTRHDRGSFNASVGSLKIVQDLARTALGLPSDAILEHVALPRSILLESAPRSDDLSIVYLRFSGVET